MKKKYIVHLKKGDDLEIATVAATSKKSIREYFENEGYTVLEVELEGKQFKNSVAV